MKHQALVSAHSFVLTTSQVALYEKQYDNLTTSPVALSETSKLQLLPRLSLRQSLSSFAKAICISLQQLATALTTLSQGHSQRVLLLLPSKEGPRQGRCDKKCK